LAHRRNDCLEACQVAQGAQVVIPLSMISIRVAKFHGLLQLRQRVIRLAQARQRASQPVSHIPHHPVAARWRVPCRHAPVPTGCAPEQDRPVDDATRQAPHRLTRPGSTPRHRPDLDQRTIGVSGWLRRNRPPHGDRGARTRSCRVGSANGYGKALGLETGQARPVGGWSRLLSRNARGHERDLAGC